MTIADSTVWIDYFNDVTSAHTQRLDEDLSDRAVLLGDYISSEVLRGFRLERDVRNASALFNILPEVPMLGPERARHAATKYRSLRRRGITVRKPNDAIIASYCIDEGHELLATDRDFRPYVLHLGLALALPLAT